MQAAGARYGERVAVEDGDVRLSFAELADAGLRATRAFCAAGLRHGDRVAIWAPNIVEWILAAIGLQAAGGVLVPLNTRFKGAEAGYVLRKSGARMLFTVGEFLGVNYVEALAGEELPDLERIVTLRGGAQGADSWDEFLAGGEPFPEDVARARAAAVEPDDLSDLLFTSGTTGRPKGVMTTHGQNLRAFAVLERGGRAARGRPLPDREPLLPRLRLQGGLALVRSCAAPRSFPTQVFDVPAVLERIGRDRISMLPGPPTLYQSILAHPDLGQHDLSSLRLAVTGAAAIPVELIHRMRDELGFETVITGYGLTETCGVVSMCRHDDDAETIATTSGRAIPDVEVRCVDAAGKEVPRGEPGEVVVRGYNVMKGYFEDEAETAKAIDADGWLHTGDIGRDGRARLPPHHRSHQGHVHHGRVQLLPGRDREPDVRQRDVLPGGRDRRARRAHGRGGHGLGGAGPGPEVDARGGDRLVPRAHGELQGAALRRDRGRAADQRLGQGDEVQAARARGRFLVVGRTRDGLR